MGRSSGLAGHSAERLDDFPIFDDLHMRQRRKEQFPDLWYGMLGSAMRERPEDAIDEVRKNG
jgi:hypothetical protein